MNAVVSCRADLALLMISEILSRNRSCLPKGKGCQVCISDHYIKDFLQCFATKMCA